MPITKRNCGIARTPKSQRWNSNRPSDTKGRPSTAVVEHGATVFSKKHGRLDNVSITAGGKARGYSMKVEKLSRGIYIEAGVSVAEIVGAK